MTLVNITVIPRTTRGSEFVYMGESGRGGRALNVAPHRLWDKVEKTESCWLWTGGVDAYGYGQIARSGQSPVKAHRLSWVFAHGPITPKQHVLHRCDTPRCVNPDHLFLGDQAANMKDAARKGRLLGNRKLTEAQIAEIRLRYVSHQNGKALAREFGVCLQTVMRTAKGTHRRTRPAPPLLGRDAGGAVPPPPVRRRPSALVSEQ